MGRESAKLGSNIGDLLTTLTGGRDYGKSYAAGANAQSLADLRGAQRGKLSAETEKLMAELTAGEEARAMTVADFGRGQGYTPDDVAQQSQFLESGQYLPSQEPKYLPSGEEVVGPRDLTTERPASYTPQDERKIQSIIQMLDLNKLTGRKSNAAQVASGARTQNIESMAAALLKGADPTATQAMQARAAAEGRSISPGKSGTVNPLQRDIDTLMGLGKSLKEALVIKFPSMPTSDKTYDKTYSDVMRGTGSASLAQAEALKAVRLRYPSNPLQIDENDLAADYSK